jgi:isocitrate dehydrogenase (NAD+)
MRRQTDCIVNYFNCVVCRYAGVPVDFEEVNIDPSTEGNDDLEYAITSIRRNGVALKGNNTNNDHEECTFV